MIEIITMLDITTMLASTGTTGTTLMTGDGTTTGGTIIVAIGIIAIGAITFLSNQESILSLYQGLTQNQKNQE